MINRAAIDTTEEMKKMTEELELPNTKLKQGMDLVDSMSADELNLLVDYIRHVFKSKRADDAAKIRASLRVNDHVKLTGNYKPKYLNGMTGVVVEKKQTRVVVLLDQGPTGKFRTGKVVTSASGLTVMN